MYCGGGDASVDIFLPYRFLSCPQCCVTLNAFPPLDDLAVIGELVSFLFRQVFVKSYSRLMHACQL